MSNLPTHGETGVRLDRRSMACQHIKASFLFPLGEAGRVDWHPEELHG
jgi:hypothetical protein